MGVNAADYSSIGWEFFIGDSWEDELFMLPQFRFVVAGLGGGVLGCLVSLFTPISIAAGAGLGALGGMALLLVLGLLAWCFCGAVGLGQDIGEKLKS